MSAGVPRSCEILAIAVAFVVGANCVAQEVGSVDLTKITTRMELRRPPPQHESGPCGGIEQIRGCFDSSKKVGALRADVVSLDRTHYQVGDEPTFEVTLENAGAGPVRIPFSSLSEH